MEKESMLSGIRNFQEGEGSWTNIAPSDAKILVQIRKGQVRVKDAEQDDGWIVSRRKDITPRDAIRIGENLLKGLEEREE